MRGAEEDPSLPTVAQDDKGERFLALLRMTEVAVWLAQAFRRRRQQDLGVFETPKVYDYGVVKVQTSEGSLTAYWLSARTHHS